MLLTFMFSPLSFRTGHSGCLLEALCRQESTKKRVSPKSYPPCPKSTATNDRSFREHALITTPAWRRRAPPYILHRHEFLDHAFWRNSATPRGQGVKGSSTSGWTADNRAPILTRVPLSNARRLTDPNIRLRCPHCGHVFPRQDKGRCPACRQVFLIPPAAREHVEEMRDRCIRISRDRRDRLFRMQRGGGLLATRRMRRTLAIVSFVVLGILLPLDYMMRRTGGQPPVLSYDGRTRQTLGVLRTKLECFRRDCGRYPADAEGLWALALNPGATNWGGPYLSKIPPDLWRHRYFYGCTNDTVRLWSAGPDGIPHTADDIPAPPPALVYVAATATNGPPRQIGEETVIEIITTRRAQELMGQARTNRAAGRERAERSER